MWKTQNSADQLFCPAKLARSFFSFFSVYHPLKVYCVEGASNNHHFSVSQKYHNKRASNICRLSINPQMWKCVNQGMLCGYAVAVSDQEDFSCLVVTPCKMRSTHTADLWAGCGPVIKPDATCVATQTTATPPSRSEPRVLFRAYSLARVFSAQKDHNRRKSNQLMMANLCHTYFTNGLQHTFHKQVLPRLCFLQYIVWIASSSVVFSGFLGGKRPCEVWGVFSRYRRLSLI